MLPGTAADLEHILARRKCTLENLLNRSAITLATGRKGPIHDSRLPLVNTAAGLQRWAKYGRQLWFLPAGYTPRLEASLLQGNDYGINRQCA
tara:strand:- start:237 stop:512 length:276 start_codon:yes stop_codon:yes gene_type:complete